MPSSVIVRAQAQESHAVAALAHDLIALLLSGSPLISTTLSSMRVNTRTTSRYSSQSNRACGVNGSRTKRVRFTEPSRQEP